MKHEAGNTPLYVDGDIIRMVTFGPSALVGNYTLTSSSGKEIEKIENAHFACLNYKLNKSGKYFDELSIGFHRDIESCQ